MQVVTDMTFEELETASTAEAPRVVACVKGKQLYPLGSSIDRWQLDLVLVPFDEDKGGPEEWQHFTGLLSLCWQQTPATLMHAACQCDAAPLVFTERSPASRASPQRPQEP